MIQTVLELELAGQGNGWTVVPDLSGDQRVSYGIFGSGILDRMASTGRGEFRLKNDPSNSGGLRSYYSPGHANARAGFLEGIRARLSWVANGEQFYKFVGTIDEITPEPGIYGRLETAVMALDYMDDLAKANVTGVEVQVNQQSSDIFSLLIATMVKQPVAIQVGEGVDIYPLSLDNVRDESSKLYAVIVDLITSELGYCYIKGDTLTGGVLVFEPRSTRAAIGTNVDTFQDYEIIEIQYTRRRRDVLNKIVVTNHPKRVDADATTKVIYALRSVTEIGPFETVQLLGPYRDPDNPGQRIGATDVTAPVSGTDYKFNAQADGLGADLTANFTVVANATGNGVRWTITNNAGVTAYFGGPTAGTILQLRGKGVYDFDTVILEAQDAESQDLYGVNTGLVDMRYQSDPAVGMEAAAYLLNLYKDPLAQVRRVTFKVPNSDEVFAARLLRREISDRIGLQETVTGLATTRGYFINGIEIESDRSENLLVSWTLAPADHTNYWLLEIVGASELDQTTRLGFGLILGHTDVAHADTHGDVVHADVVHQDSHSDAAFIDVAHGDVAHTDTHTDTAFVDVAHGDGVAHGDVAHGDVAHVDTAYADTAHVDVVHSDVAFVDVAHGDVAFIDVHSDTAHTDTAHADSHSDVVHVDSHFDTAHTDTHLDDPFEDTAHQDSHGDVVHGDVAHVDTPHTDELHQDGYTDLSHNDYWDIAHGDSHTDVAHTDSHDDIAFVDEAHEDAHSDVTHVDTHLDTAHADAHTDVAHGDVAHGDAHSDTVHTDTAHADTVHADVVHQDTAHVDTAHADVTHSDVAHDDDVAHTDIAHGDVVHADVAHVDTAHTDTAHGDVAHADVAHADVNHSDVAFVDTHSDTAHGDIN